MVFLKVKLIFKKYFAEFQRNLPGGVLQKKYSWKSRKIHRKTLAPDWHECFPVNFENF